MSAQRCGCLVTKRFPGSNLFEKASPLCLLVHVLVHVLCGLSYYIVQHTARANHLVSLLFKMSYAATCDLLRHYAICRKSDLNPQAARPWGFKSPSGHQLASVQLAHYQRFVATIISADVRCRKRIAVFGYKYRYSAHPFFNH